MINNFDKKPIWFELMATRKLKPCLICILLTKTTQDFDHSKSTLHLEPFFKGFDDIDFSYKLLNNMLPKIN